MATLDASRSADVQKACQAGAAEAGAGLSRTLDVAVTVTVGEPGPLDVSSVGAVAGMMFAFQFPGGAGGLAWLEEASSLVPTWCVSPDPTGTSKLATLAQELSMLLWPEDLMADDSRALWRANLASALVHAQPLPDALVLPLELAAADGRSGKLLVAWPVSSPLAATTVEEAAVTASPAPEPAAPPPSAPAAPPVGAAAVSPPQVQPANSPSQQPEHVAPDLPPRPTSIDDLPSYSRSLLSVRVPLRVTLARKMQPVGQVLDISPGTLIQFPKACDEPLDVEVADHPVAQGEAVKVGEKFGIRITSIKLPHERFQSIRPAV